VVVRGLWGLRELERCSLSPKSPASPEKNTLLKEKKEKKQKMI
jgi:hypothetical protein